MTRIKKLLKIVSPVKLLVCFLFVSCFFIFLFLAKIFDANAELITTQVTVGNSAPEITSGPIEDPASSTSSPTSIGSDVTWKATAKDNNGDNYYLIICSTDSVTPVNNNPPTCGATMWCRSNATASEDPAQCSRTALEGDAYSNNWYAFVCDGTSAAACSSPGDPGTGDSGSPFYVNHVPSFTAVSNDSPDNPGGSITWSTTASDATDGHNVKLLVCKTQSITGGSCTGDSWCSSSFVASNPSCQYDIPSVAPDGSFNAYTYIIDSLNTPATGEHQGSNVSFAINNEAPIIGVISLNGGVDIVLLESTTKAVTINTTVTDTNSCQDISSVKAYVYRSGVAYSGCDTVGEANNNNCYPEVSCSVSGESCEGSTDGSADYTCTANLQYYADPTDSNTQYPDDNWLVTIKATDDDDASDTEQISQGVEVESLIAFSITSSINYGSLGVNQKVDPLSKVVRTTATGNVGLNQEHSGSANMCVDYPTCSGGTPIGVAYQKYAITSSVSYDDGDNAIALSTTPAPVTLNVLKVTTETPTYKDTWWGILIPTGTDAGAYEGRNTITGAKSNPSNW